MKSKLKKDDRDSLRQLILDYGTEDIIKEIAIYNSQRSFLLQDDDKEFTMKLYKDAVILKSLKLNT